MHDAALICARQGLPMERGTIRLLDCGSSLRRSALAFFILLLSLFQHLRIGRAGVILPVVRSLQIEEGKGMTEEHVKEHDFRRSRHLLAAVADFPVHGGILDFGFYYTEIELGTPPQKYNVRIDTSGPMLGVKCEPCLACPRENDLSVPLHFYDLEKTTSGKRLPCTSLECTVSGLTYGQYCKDSLCYYDFEKVDPIRPAGYLVEDVLALTTVVDGQNVRVDSTISFGCGFNETGRSSSLSSWGNPLDGVFGLGKSYMSVLSQLARRQYTPNQFGHCLRGVDGRGGFFVIGEFQEPGMVFTPMDPDVQRYSATLEYISIGNTLLNIEPAVFNISFSKIEAVFDSALTSAVLVPDVFQVFLTKLRSVVDVPSFVSKDTVCFEETDRSLDELFPTVSLHFEGGAKMELRPENYINRQTLINKEGDRWCVAWASSTSVRTYHVILGDMVLMNKLVIYDIINSRIGWKDRDCEPSSHDYSVCEGLGCGVMYTLANGRRLRLDAIRASNAPAVVSDGISTSQETIDHPESGVHKLSPEIGLRVFQLVVVTLVCICIVV